MCRISEAKRYRYCRGLGTTYFRVFVDSTVWYWDVCPEDVAREIYRNVTLEKMDFIRFLQSHRKQDTERQLRWSAQQQVGPDPFLVVHIK